MYGMNNIKFMTITIIIIFPRTMLLGALSMNCCPRESLTNNFICYKLNEALRQHLAKDARRFQDGRLLQFCAAVVVWDVC
jgi:hypothetical protein